MPSTCKMTDEHIKINKQELRTRLKQSLVRRGIASGVADAILDAMFFAEIRGYVSHGFFLLPDLVKNIEAGLIIPDEYYEVLFQNDQAMMIDGHRRVGYYIARMAIWTAIEAARKNGIAIATVRNSTHFGAGGYYADLAARQNLICMIFSNTRPHVASPNGTKAIIGTNPITVSAPAGEGNPPFLLDMSTSIKSYNEILYYFGTDGRIPKGWGINKDGELTDLPKDIIDGGALLPLGGHDPVQGGHKGFGLSIFVELLTAILSGGTCSPKLQSDDPSRCHTFIVINPALFVPIEQFANESRQFFDFLREASNTRIPGQHGHQLERDHAAELMMKKHVYDSIMKLIT